MLSELKTDLDLVSAGLLYLNRRLAAIENRVRAAVARRRSVDPDPDDRFRGLYISDAQVDHILGLGASSESALDPDTITFLARVEAAADDAERQGAEIRLRTLRRAFSLDEIDIQLLLATLAPDLDPRFERLYAYLNDDVSRRRPTTGLALELCGLPLSSGRDRARFNLNAKLLFGGLLIVEESERPFLTRALRVPDRVIGYVLGDDSTDPMIAALETHALEAKVPGAQALGRALSMESGLSYVRERPGAAGFSLAATAFSAAGVPWFALDLGRLDHTTAVHDLATTASREARLRGGGLIIGPIDGLAERDAAGVRALAEMPAPVVLVGARGWDPSWSREVPLIVEAPILDTALRAEVWRRTLDGQLPTDIDPARTTAHFRLTPEQVVRAARAAVKEARAGGRCVSVADLQSGSRAQNAAGLERLSRRLEPKVGWNSLILPRSTLEQLHELTARVRHRDTVLDRWGLGRHTSRGRGITALFAGESGTGKTMSAEAVAGDLGLDLYVIDLSTVIDKYVGETEKNLERIFVEADRVNGVLLFDEADAIFGKRSEVRDAHDRYANVEVAYLLSRMERFDGLAILTSNLRANIDEAFTRRLSAVVDFPMPEVHDRELLWQLYLSSDAPRAADVDVVFLANAFKISGGNIRNIVLAASYFAAEEERELGMVHLVRATEREYRKLGHLCREDEFGQYFYMLSNHTEMA